MAIMTAYRVVWDTGRTTPRMASADAEVRGSKVRFRERCEASEFKTEVSLVEVHITPAKAIAAERRVWENKDLLARREIEDAGKKMHALDVLRAQRRSA